MVNFSGDQWTVQVGNPAGASPPANELLLALLYCQDPDVAAAGYASSPGFNTADSATFSIAGTSNTDTVLWRLTDGSEGANLDFDFSNDCTKGSAAIIAYNCVNAVTPIDGVSMFGGNNSTNTDIPDPGAGDVNINQPNDQVVMEAIDASRNVTFSAPPGQPSTNGALTQQWTTDLGGFTTTGWDGVNTLPGGNDIGNPGADGMTLGDVYQSFFVDIAPQGNLGNTGIKLVQSSQTLATGSSVGIALNGPVTAGNTLVLIPIVQTGTATTDVVMNATDGTNSWNATTPAQNGDGAAPDIIEIKPYYAFDVAGGFPTVQVNLNGIYTVDLFLMEFEGDLTTLFSEATYLNDWPDTRWGPFSPTLLNVNGALLVGAVAGAGATQVISQGPTFLAKAASLSGSAVDYGVVGTFADIQFKMKAVSDVPTTGVLKQFILSGPTPFPTP